MLEKYLSFVKGNIFPIAILAIQTIGYFVINGVSLNWSLLALTGTIVGSLAMWFHNPIHLKVTMLFMGFIWLSYQLVSGAYGQIPGELVFLAGITASIVMLFNAQRKGINLETVEEIPVLIRRKLSQRKLTQNTTVTLEKQEAVLVS